MSQTPAPLTSNAERYRVKTPDGRMYQWGADRFVSVTTILSALGKPWLGAWAAKMAAEYAYDNRNVWTELPKIEATKLIKSAPWDTRDKAGNLGTAVHDAIEAHILSEPLPEYSDTVAPRMSHFEQFLIEYEPHFFASEAVVFSKQHRYAGTLDAIAEIGGETLLIDVKTSKSVYPEFALQLAAYKYGQWLGLPNGDAAPMPEIDGAAVLHITPKGYRLIRVRCDEEVFRHFLYVAQCWRWMKEVAPTAILDDVAIPPRRAA